MPRGRRVLLIGFVLLPLLSSSALADGKVSGRVTSPEGLPLEGIKVVLVPEAKGAGGRMPAKTKKDGNFFFGIVPNGRYTLTVEDTKLVPYSIHLLAYDEEKKQDTMDYQGPPPTTPQVFDVDSFKPITYDLVMGEASQSPAAVAKRQQEAQTQAQQVPALLQSGDFGGALALINEALKATPDDPNLLYFRGFALFRTKDYQGAKTSLTKVLELNPSQPGAHFILAGVLSDLGEKAEAIAEFEREVANPATDTATKAKCYLNMGLLQRELGKPQAAIASFEKVLELDPKQADAYAELNELYLSTAQAERAAQIQARAKEAGAPENPNAVFNIGANYWNHKEYAKAAEYFRRATELDPNFALAWKNLGYADVNLGNTQEATNALKKYLTLEPRAEDAQEVQELIAALSQP